MSNLNRSLNRALALLKELRDTTPITAQRKRIDEFLAINHNAQREMLVVDDCVKACSEAWHRDAYYVCSEGDPTYKTYCHAFDAGWNAAHATVPVSKQVTEGAADSSSEGYKVKYPKTGNNEPTPSAKTEQPVECPECKGEGEYFYGGEPQECFACKPHELPKRKDEAELLSACENFFESWFGPAIGHPEAMQRIEERRKKTKQEFSELLFRFVQTWQPVRESGWQKYPGAEPRVFEGSWCSYPLLFHTKDGGAQHVRMGYFDFSTDCFYESGFQMEWKNQVVAFMHYPLPKTTEIEGQP